MLTSWKAQGKLTNIYADGGGAINKFSKCLGEKQGNEKHKYKWNEHT
jgi:hypothetical protein